MSRSCCEIEFKLAIITNGSIVGNLLALQCDYSISIPMFTAHRQVFGLPQRSTLNLARRVRWTPDGTALIYKDSMQGLWRQQLDEQEPRPVKGLEDLLLAQLVFAFDGKSLAYTTTSSTRDIILLGNIK